MFRKLGLLFAAMVLSMSMVAGVSAGHQDEDSNWTFVAIPGTERTVSGTTSCQVGESHRTGTQETTDTYQMYAAYNPSGNRVAAHDHERLVSSEPTGDCQNTPGPQPRN